MSYAFIGFFKGKKVPNKQTNKQTNERTNENTNKRTKSQASKLAEKRMLRKDTLKYIHFKNDLQDRGGFHRAFFTLSKKKIKMS